MKKRKKDLISLRNEMEHLQIQFDSDRFSVFSMVVCPSGPEIYNYSAPYVNMELTFRVCVNFPARYQLKRLKTL